MLYMESTLLLIHVSILSETENVHIKDKPNIEWCGTFEALTRKRLICLYLSW